MGPDLKAPEGGSLNRIRFDGETVVKWYTGDDPRGHEKLLREYAFLKSLPAEVAGHFSDPLSFSQKRTPAETELVIARHPAAAVAKSILQDRATPERVGEITARALDLLLGHVYPLRSRRESGEVVYREFHAARLAKAMAVLQEHPDLCLPLHSPAMVVNGRDCPSIADAVAWLAEHWSTFFQDCNLVLAHGDAHLDNILATVEGPLDLLFVDPRGDELLPPSYDFAKLLKAARCGYDLIHYGRRSLTAKLKRKSFHVLLSVERTYSAHYSAVLEELKRALPRFAAAQGVPAAPFIASVLASEFAHIVSFAYYHARHPEGYDHERVLSYLAVAALLARELMEPGPFDTGRLFAPVLTP